VSDKPSECNITASFSIWRVGNFPFSNGRTHGHGFSHNCPDAGRQLSATLFARGSLGATTFSFGQNTRQWSVYGALGLVKQIGRSSVGLNYSRGDTLSNGLIANRYADRVDLTYQSRVTARINWTAGSGYLRQVESGGFSGWYATSGVQFLLAPEPVFSSLLIITVRINQPIPTISSAATEIYIRSEFAGSPVEWWHTEELPRQL